MKNDIKIIANPGPVKTFPVDDRTTSSDIVIKPGEPVIMAGAGTNFVQHLATATPTNAAPMLGIAITESTETSTVDGYVNVCIVIPGLTVMRAKATTAANINTEAKLKAIMMDTVCLETSAVATVPYTINEDEGTDPNVHGCLIIGGDIAAGTLDFVLQGYASLPFSSI